MEEKLDRKLAKNLDEASAIMGKIYEELNELGVKVDSMVLDRAMDIFREALEKRLTRGRYINIMVAASLYCAAREAGYALTFEHIRSASMADKREIARYYRLLVKNLHVKISSLSPVDIVERAAKNLQIPKDEKKIAVKILKRALERDVCLMSRHPFGLAAAALYMAGLIRGCRFTQGELAEELGVSEVTVRENLNELKNLLDVSVYV